MENSASIASGVKNCVVRSIGELISYPISMISLTNHDIHDISKWRHQNTSLKWRHVKHFTVTL